MIDLDQGSEELMYTAHFFPKKDVPTDRVDPLKQKTIDKARKEHLFTKHSHIWICGYQSHDTKKNTRLIRLIVNDSPKDDNNSADAD